MQNSTTDDIMGLLNTADRGSGGPAALQPAGQNPYPSTDPSVVASVLQQLVGVREADHLNLASEQDEVLMMILNQFGMLGASTPEAGVAEGADELAVPSAAPPSNPSDQSGELSALLSMLSGGEAPAAVDPSMLMMGMPTEDDGMMPLDAEMQNMSDEELMALMQGLA